jgi:hypothetical protein
MSARFCGSFNDSRDLRSGVPTVQRLKLLLEVELLGVPPGPGHLVLITNVCATGAPDLPRESRRIIPTRSAELRMQRSVDSQFFISYHLRARFRSGETL